MSQPRPDLSRLNSPAFFDTDTQAPSPTPRPRRRRGLMGPTTARGGLLEGIKGMFGHRR
ncbi:MAG: hypothetical protein ACFB21_09415 [Opitutales bacterium]